MLVRIKFLQKIGPFMSFIRRWRTKRAHYINGMVKKHLRKSDIILNFGPGDCIVDSVFQKNGYNTIPVDIENLSLVKGISPIIYDGTHLPFKDNVFDVSVLITVLHHIPNPENAIKEVMRVSKRIVIFEEIFHNTIEKYALFFFDSLLNQKFRGEPHTNKTDSGWRESFEKLGLKVVDSRYNRWYLVQNHAVYLLEKK